MAYQEKQLGQLRPLNTTAASLYSPGSNVTAIIKSVVVANTSGSSASGRIFLDDDGTTYDESTALYWDVGIDAGSTLQIDTFWAMNDSSGNLAVRSSAASGLTFTAFGVEIS